MMKASRLLVIAMAILGLAVVLAACGSAGGGGGSSTVAAPPADLNAPATGTLRIFSYEDTVAPKLLDPFKKQNPDLNVETATFASDQEAAAKMSGGFSADVVEVCLDEAKPLMARKLLAPLDPKGIADWDQMAFTDAPGVTVNGKTYIVPLSAGPEGLIYNTDEIPGGIDSWKDLFDPAYEGKVSVEGDNPLATIAETALANGSTDPWNLSNQQVDDTVGFLEDHRSQFRSLWQSDSDLVNLFKSGEITLADGGSGVAKRIAAAGVPVKWVAPKEGVVSWVCGLALTSDSKNTDAAYRLMNWQSSAKAQAIRAEDGYTVTNPKAMALIPASVQKTADPEIVRNGYAETEPPNYPYWVRAFQGFEAG